MEFAAKYPEEHKSWHENSNYVVVLSVDNEHELITLSNSLKEKGVNSIEFREPDINNELTSISVVPAEGVKELLSGLSLAGRRHKSYCEEKNLRDRERRLRNLCP